MRWFLRAAALAAVATSTLACSSSTENITTPSALKCSVTAAAAPAAFSAAGGTGTVNISANRDCAWSASAATAWIQLDGTPSGQGDGSVRFTVAANQNPSARNGSIKVGELEVGVAEEAAPCTFSVSPVNDSVSPAGGRRTVQVTASFATCAWSAHSNVDWLTIASGAQGTGSGQVAVDAGATTGPTRSGTVVVAGQVVTIAQGDGCHYSVDPLSQSSAAAGGSGVLNVHSAAGCQWTAGTNTPWISLTSGSTGSGDGHVQFAIARSTGPARTGTVTAAGQVVSVMQASGCSYVLSPPTQSFEDGGGTSTFSVITADGCPWTATPQASWIAISAGASGIGNGVVTLYIGVNAMGGPARTGTITVNDQAFTANQAAGPPCVYTLAPTTQVFPAAGGNGSFSVTTVATCPWVPYPSAPWIIIAGPPSGSGNGTVYFGVAPNTPGSPARTGAISVGGPTFTISEDAAP